MRAFNAAVMYVMIWWVVLFAVLPIGVRTLEHTDNPAGWQGAPQRPMMWRKLLVTTLVSFVLWGVAVVLIHQGWIDFRSTAPLAGE